MNSECCVSATTRLPVPLTNNAPRSEPEQFERVWPKGIKQKMPDIVASRSGTNFLPGEAYLSETPVLQTHAGTQPDLFLRWNTIPLAASGIDVVIHLHGFSRSGETMPLSEKVPRSGLDLSRRTRPTLAVLPRGNWLRYSWYDFPALMAGGIDRLIDYALSSFGLVASLAGGGLGVSRFVLTAHSGGGMPAIDAIPGAQRLPDELYIFDGLYRRDPTTGDPMRGLETIDHWLGERFAREPDSPGALRVVYIEQQTGPFSREVGGLIAKNLASVDPADAASFRRRYRVEPSAVQHARIAERCGPDLLGASDVEFDWPR
jgi:hypothetical protein